MKALAEISLAAATAPVFRADGVYLIAGGFGYLGQQLSLALAKHHRATLVLWSRGALDDERRTHCRQLEALGAKVICDTVDVADAASVERAYRKLKRSVGVVHGVFHLARQHDDRMIARKPWSSFQQVVQTKVQGTQHLDEVTRDEPLDFFAMFSSLGAYGVRGGSDYSYATAFQNAFSVERARLTADGRRSGATVAFCWGPWLEDRLFPKSRATLAEAGFGLIDIEQGFPLIERALATTITPLAIVAMQEPAKVRRILGLEAGAPVPSGEPIESETPDARADLERELTRWEELRAQGRDVASELGERFSESDIAHLPAIHVNRVYHLLFGANGNSDTAPAKRVVAAVPPLSASSTVASGPATTVDAMAILLRIVFKDVLQLPAIHDARTFQDYGMDSISGMQAAVRLEKLLKRDVPPQWLINYPTIAALSKHLLTEKFTLPPGDSP